MPHRLSASNNPNANVSAAPVASIAVTAAGDRCPLRPSIAGVDESSEPLGRVRDRLSVSSAKSAVGPEINDLGEFREDLACETRTIFSSLREECRHIEDNIRDAERDVEHKEDEAFIIRASEVELQRLMGLQSAERKKKREAFEKLISARTERQKAKFTMKRLMRDTKARDVKIQQQEALVKATLDLKTALSHRRQAFEMSMNGTEARHIKQLQLMAAAQDRRIAHEKRISNLEVKHMSEEARAASTKKFAVFLTHRKAMDKRLSDHLREIQRLEMKHAKERFDCEFLGFEEIATQKMNHGQEVEDTECQHLVELHRAKDKLRSYCETAKLMQIESAHKAEMRRIVMQHKAIIKQVKEAQRARMQDGFGSTVGRSRGASLGHSRTGSDSSMASRAESAFSGASNFSGNNNEASLNSAVKSLGVDTESEESLDDVHKAVARMEENLGHLKLRLKESLIELTTQQRASLDATERNVAERLRELEENQDLEMKTIRSAQEIEITELKATQEKEVKMEEVIRDSEYKMLLERKLLNAVLDTCIDGIITIDPIGTILRFNCSAEKQFGYTAREVLGNNIKMLMPESFAKNHDQYLINYLTTGVRKVLGSGRRVQGKRKDGSFFPVHLSISEVKEDSAHVFTGIVRDLTAEVEAECQAKESEAKKQAELQALITELDASKARSDALLSQMLPPAIATSLKDGIPVQPQAFERATVFFSDIVGFTSLASQCSPMEIVGILNDLYTMFDEVISQYDAYKVETIGDAYMVVSGVPNPNGVKHAGEIATMALHLLSAVGKYQVRGKPDYKLSIRIGMNSGPVVAGVVGQKMPRYCLFGDTVNVASRMESTGAPMRIQISETTFVKLNTIGGYKTTFRGETSVKGKGQMKTYWLTGKDDFPYELPPQ
ncbi:guanylate cyclase [Synchytrium endobioticum]|uniref:guanylate cyclase n=1 Tax=Synchytrium endobioticum TaxID=286115 RepID=A0A507DB75_9FUNG|nr:guanylate cyclase [Synchytrium endobioticum]